MGNHVVAASVVTALVAIMVAWTNWHMQWSAAQVSAEPSVPIVHLKSPTAGRAILQACAEFGMFRLIGHGVDTAIVTDASRRLFNLPEEVKAVQANSKEGLQRGYIKLGGEAGLAKYLELKEGFAYGYPWNASILPSNPLQGPNVWPAGAPVEELQGWFREAVHVATDVHVLLAKELGWDASKTASMLEGGDTISLMRMFHYFPADEYPELAPGLPRLGSSPHSDWFLLTVVAQDATGGLQVEHKGDWLDVPSNPGELVVITGDYFSLLSKKRLTSPVHRVLLPPAGQDRHSLVFFFYPRYDATFEGLITTSPSGTANSDAEHNTLLDQFTQQQLLRPVGEYVVGKWRGVIGNAAS